MAEGQPMYRQIADELRAQIKSGELKAGDKLPTEADLSDSYNASRNTIRDAVELLVREGLIEKRQGQGTFVTLKAPPFVTVLSSKAPGIDGGGMEGATYKAQVSEQHRRPSSTKPKVEVQDCPRQIALRLRVADGADVISRHQRRYIDEVPWSLQTSFYPFELAAKADRLLKAADIEEGTVRYLADTWGLDQVGYRDWITVRAPDSDEQQFFRLGPEKTIFEVFRTAFATGPGGDPGHRPVRVTVTVYPADRNQLVCNSGDVPPELYELEPAEQDPA
jgi:GntR family transcriptional regulator